MDVQPVFNRQVSYRPKSPSVCVSLYAQLISELADTVAACLLDLTDLSVGVQYEGALAEDVILAQQLSH